MTPSPAKGGLVPSPPSFSLRHPLLLLFLFFSFSALLTWLVTFSPSWLRLLPLKLAFPPSPSGKLTVRKAQSLPFGNRIIRGNDPYASLAGTIVDIGNYTLDINRYGQDLHLAIPPSTPVYLKAVSPKQEVKMTDDQISSVDTSVYFSPQDKATLESLIVGDQVKVFFQITPEQNLDITAIQAIRTKHE